MTGTAAGRREGGPPARMRRWPSPCLMLITDRTRLRGRPLEETVSRAVDGGANVVQLREKDLPAGDLYEIASTLREVLGDRALLLVNERADVAVAAGADGIHLPERGLPTERARELAGEGLIIGRSVHSVEAAVQAEREGIAFVQVGAVYETASKPGATPAGVDLVRAVAGAVRVSVVAVGGITPDNVAEVVAAGAGGAAVIGAIMDADEPEDAARRLREAMENTREA